MYLNVRATSSTSTSATPAPTATSSQNVGTTSSAPASAAATTTVVVNASDALPKGPIIAGSICGVLVLVILVAMLWFFCRRRRQLDMIGGRSTPLVGSNGNEKFAMDHSPDEEAQRHSGGVFAPFGGYYRTPSVEARDTSGHSLDIGTSRNVEPDRDADAPIPDIEKGSVVAPPVHEHPAYHPMPGQSPEIPVYNQTQLSAHPASRQGSTRVSEPAYNSLPSQDPKRSSSATSIQRQHAYSSLPLQSLPEPTYNPHQPQRSRAPYKRESQPEIPTPQPIKTDVPETSPELPALTFSPISLDTNPSTGTAFNFPSPTDVPVNLINRFPSPSELGSSASQFRPTPLSEAEIAEIGSSMSQYRPTPLSEMVPTPSATPFRPTPSSLNEHTTDSSYFSPTSPPIPPMPHVSLPNQRIYRNPSISKIVNLPHPATLPSPTPPPLKLNKRNRRELPAVSTTPRKSSIPPKDLPFNYISLPSPQGTEADDSDVQRETSSRNTYSIPIGLDPSKKLPKAKKSIKEKEKGREKDKGKDGKTDPAVRLTHNHSREWSESDREHVMSWATYTGPNSPLEEQDEFSPMVEQVARVERFEKVDGKVAFKRKGPSSKTEPKPNGVIPELEHLQRPQKEAAKRGSKVMCLINSASGRGKKNSPRNDIVSPLFSPMMPGHTFSPLSPEERQWAGQE